MTRHLTLKKYVCFIFFILNIHTAFCADTSDVVCPTTNELQQFNLLETFMHGFDPKTQKITFAALLEQGVLGNWALEIDLMQAGQGDDVTVITTETVQQLMPVSSTPFADDLSGLTGERLPVCVYTLPGNDRVFALAFFFGDFMTTTLSMESPEMQRRLLMIQHFHNR